MTEDEWKTSSSAYEKFSGYDTTEEEEEERERKEEFQADQELDREMEERSENWIG